MSLLSDQEIKTEVAVNDMIFPFVPNQVRTIKGRTVNEVRADNGLPLLTLEPEGNALAEEGKKIISYGLSSYGYDIRCVNKWKIFTNAFGEIIDPKAFAPRAFVETEDNYCIIPPNSFVLTSSVEYFRMPKDILGICIGKSTYARCGLVVNITPLEAGWEGNLTIELSNTTPLPLKVYAGEGIAQLIFFRGQPCLTTYADRAGKYQGQTGIVTSKL